MQFSDSDKWYLKTSKEQIEIWSGRKQLQIRSTINSDEESPGPVKEIKVIERKTFSSPEAAIHLASAMDRDLWPAPIFSPRFTDFRSFCAVSYLYQNGGPGNKFWTRN